MFSPTTYFSIEDKASDLWEETALEELAKVADLEKQLAIENEDVTWAKRFYRMN